MMKYWSFVFFVLLFAACSEPEIVLVSPSESYRIVIPDQAAPQEIGAAAVLQTYLRKISGRELVVAALREAEGEGNIVLCTGARTAFSGDTAAAPGNDGFRIYTRNNNLYIVGGSGNGLAYGVYTFLEEYLGCRMYAPGAQVIPARTEVRIPQRIDNRQEPVMAHRHLGYRGKSTGEYAMWNKISPAIGTPESHWGSFAETLYRLLPAEKYYRQHPEYYALYNGKRVPSQLCLTNPDVLREVTANLKEWMAARPDALYWSVSQNDNTGYCRCDRCEAVHREEGTPSGTLIRFVNQVAAAFPDKVISTLAYTYSREAPKQVKPAPNVSILFCNIECNRSCPLETDTLSASFRNDLTGWEQITDSMFVWDYVIQFKNLVSPFPNLRTLQPNLAYLAAHGVTGMFEQGNREVGGEFSELRSYLLAKLMWNPYQDADSIITDFTDGYYGAGGKYVKQYIDLLHDNLEKSGDRLSIFGNTLDPKKSYLSPECLRQYGELFDRAEQAEAAHPDILQRIRIARLPLTYVEIEQARVDPFGSGSLFTEHNGKYRINEPFMNKINEFILCCKGEGITRLSEWHTTPDEYLEIIRSYTDMNFDGNIALGKTCTFSPGLAAQNRKAAPGLLTDGLYGTNEYSSMWLRSSEKEYEVTVDLEKVQPVTSIAAHFMNNNSSTVFLPAEVTFFLSADGVSYTKAGGQQGPEPVNTNGPAGSYASGCKPIPAFYKTAVTGKQARFVKIRVTSIGDCPVWHPNVGAPALTMLDEVVVQ